MQIVKLEQFLECYAELPENIQRKTDKALLLLANLSHPSLRVKKLKGHKNICYARIDRNYRFTFKIEGDYLILRAVGIKNSVLNKP